MENNKLYVHIACIATLLSQVLCHPATVVSATLPAAAVKVAGDVSTAATAAVKAATDPVAASTTTTLPTTVSGQAAGSVGTLTTALKSPLETLSGSLSGAGATSLSSGLGLIRGQGDISNTLRNGAGVVIDAADRRTGQLSSSFRSGASGGAGLLDGGLQAIGIRQSVATPLVDTAWRIGENGRSAGFNTLRQGASSAFLLVNPDTMRSLMTLGGGSLSLGTLLPSASTGLATGAVTGTAV